MKILRIFCILFFSFQISAKSQVVINEIYGGGGNSGALYKNDFIELYNNGTNAVNLSGWSVQYTSRSGSSWSVTPLSGNIPPKGYFLIQQAAGGTNFSDLPTADVIGTIYMAASDGKIALVNQSSALNTSCPVNDARVIDFVGYGSADCSKGSNAPSPSNTNSIQRNPVGINTNNNSKDFKTGLPSPTNSSGVDKTPPSIVTFSPAANAINVRNTFMAHLTFDESLKKAATGIISIKKKSDNSISQTFDISNNAIQINSKDLYFPISDLESNTSYYIEMSNGAVSDLFNNIFEGISGNSIWSFTTGNNQPLGAINITYDFNDCASSLNAFSTFNVSGNEVWGCTNYGLNQSQPLSNAPYEGAIQIQGFSGGQNKENEDWLISPLFDLSATTYPVLSFWSKTLDVGNALKLKISTDYPGYGNPNNYTWTTVNGNFPDLGSNSWMLSDNISLSNFKNAHVYFAFVYTSTNTGAAQWSIDNVILKNLYNPPPPNLNLRSTNLDFGYVAPQSDSIKKIRFTPNYLLDDITIQAPEDFLLSKDSIQFSSSVTYLKASANNQPQVLFVKFSPTTPNKDYTDVITFNTQGINATDINLVGTSIDYDLTLEVVNWNMEWFGIESTSFGPPNKDLQETNIKTITKNIAADIFVFVEAVSEPRLQNVVNYLNEQFGAGTYAYFICDYGSYSNPYKSGTLPLDQLQKEAFVYKTSVIQPIETPKAIVTEGPNTALDTKSPAYSYFTSGRYPYMLYANVTLGLITKPVRFVALHAKANTNPVDVSYRRRKNGADTLNYTLNHLYPNDNIILLGDFNDDLDQSITYGFTESSYSVFNNDSLNFFSPTLSLSLDRQQSTVGYKEMIDHVEISNEMKPYYITNSAKVLYEVSTMVSNYGTTTTDHYPILTRYAFEKNVVPVQLISFTATKQNNTALLQWNTAQEMNSKLFEIEKSIDNKEWKKIGFEVAAGNSSIEKHYSFIDDKPNPNINFYRLKQIDNDEKFVYSNIQSVLFPLEQSITISPNPAHNFIKINFGKTPTKNISIDVSDVFGRKITQKITDQSSIIIDVKSWAKGIYFIKINNNQQINTYKIVVQ